MYTYRFLLLALFLGLTLSSNAQSAPDFSVTDSWGDSHQLYADYLDQGTTVVVKVFYVACPPCNAISPFLQPLYQTWGGGDADVQIIELSIKQTDTDAMVNAYKSSHSTTYPAVGGQGGSVAAVTPYTNGTFGQYTGTPTFVVIAPDRSVQYDVYGTGIQGTIDALDAAIAATGATGIISATTDPTQAFPVQLVSTLVWDELLFKSNSPTTDYTITILNELGQSVQSADLTIVNGIHSAMNVNSLASGSWICHVRDRESQRMVSYLFIKQ